ncbi:hypothetical protein INT48_000648 [Thamnidium elegans]|uniref:Uncharacterized protein n=1 Tax=Thamnidium elegans TaxID=101142 RepID=A0A8H7SIC3_9FUNG|nr:hypothetical protein INT48_000648 [Thamnidium elegans]
MWSGSYTGNVVDAAAILRKRVAPDVETCVRYINAIIPELDNQLPFIRTSNVFDTRYVYEKLRDSIVEAQHSCCDIVNIISEEDAMYYIDPIETLHDKTLTLLSLFREKVEDFNFLVKIVVSSQINDLNLLTTGLYTCFTVFTPQKQIDILQNNKEDLQKSFNLTLTTYDSIF